MAQNQRCMMFPLENIVFASVTFSNIWSYTGPLNIQHKSILWFKSYFTKNVSKIKNGITICGGESAGSTCLQYVNGDWNISHHLQASHNFHTSWTTPSGDILLLDGCCTEVVKTDGTTEVGPLEFPFPFLTL